MKEVRHTARLVDHTGSRSYCRACGADIFWVLGHDRYGERPAPYEPNTHRRHRCGAFRVRRRQATSEERERFGIQDGVLRRPLIR
jgi:hypothetical protein